MRDKGDLTGADTEIRWFVKTYTDAAAADKEVTDPEKLLVVAQAGIENATTHNKPDQFTFVLQEVLNDAVKRDADFGKRKPSPESSCWRNTTAPEAADAFDKAIKINPKAPEALVGKGLIAMERMDFAEAERLAELALKVNPKHTAALRLKADVRLAEADPAAAEKLPAGREGGERSRRIDTGTTGGNPATSWQQGRLRRRD